MRFNQGGVYLITAIIGVDEDSDGSASIVLNGTPAGGSSYKNNDNSQTSGVIIIDLVISVPAAGVISLENRSNSSTTSLLPAYDNVATRSVQLTLTKVR